MALAPDFIEKLPESMTKIAGNAFKSTRVEDKGKALSVELERASHLSLRYELDEIGSILTFKEGAETIEGVARADKKKVVSVIIPEGAKVLAAKAFEGCSLLAAATLPQTLVEIGNEAFKE